MLSSAPLVTDRGPCQCGCVACTPKLKVSYSTIHAPPTSCTLQSILALISETRASTDFGGEC